MIEGEVITMANDKLELLIRIVEQRENAVAVVQDLFSEGKSLDYALERLEQAQSALWDYQEELENKGSFENRPV